MEPVDPTPVGEPLLIAAAGFADDGLLDDEQADGDLLGDGLLGEDLFAEVAAPSNGSPTGDGGADQDRVSGSRRRWLLTGLAATVAAVAIAAFVVREDAPPPKPDIPLDAWVPYWTLDASTEVAARRIPSMRDVSPFWFNATGAGEVVIDPNASIEATEAFLDVARSSGASIVPSIVDALPAGGMAAILADPETRQTHVDALLEFVVEW